LRSAGLLAGLGVIAALWFVAASFRTGPPLLSLGLFGICPSVIIWGDNVRAHGCAMATGLVTCAFFWRFVEKPSRRSWIVAALLAVLAAQFSYYNAITILAAGAGGFAVCIRRRTWQMALATLAAGAPAALSFLPYRSVFRRAADWNMLLQMPAYDLNLFWTKLVECLDSSGWWAIWLWIGVLCVAIFLTVASFALLPDWKPSRRAQDVVLFNVVLLGVGVIAYYAFLKRLDYLTQAWYYLIMLAFTAAAMDALVGASCFTAPARISRICAGVGIFLGSAAGAHYLIPLRLSNTDLIAAELGRTARLNDFIVVDPWFYGVSYARYQASSAPWSTLPPMEFHRYQRYDLIKELMQCKDQTEPIRPLLARVQSTLQAKGRVYLVGEFHLPSAQFPLFVPPPAPESATGWIWNVYSESWSLQFGAFLRRHAISANRLSLPKSAPVCSLENSPLFVIEGWRD
jgi:hypothetical protein